MSAPLGERDRARNPRGPDRQSGAGSQGLGRGESRRAGGTSPGAVRSRSDAETGRPAGPVREGQPIDVTQGQTVKQYGIAPSRPGKHLPLLPVPGTTRQSTPPSGRNDSYSLHPRARAEAAGVG